MELCNNGQFFRDWRQAPEKIGNIGWSRFDIFGLEIKNDKYFNQLNNPPWTPMESNHSVSKKVPSVPELYPIKNITIYLPVIPSKEK